MGVKTSTEYSLCVPEIQETSSENGLGASGRCELTFSPILSQPLSAVERLSDSQRVRCGRFECTTSLLHGVKTDSPNFYKPPTRFAVVNTESPKFYTRQTRFAACAQNGLSELLQVSYTFYGCQNRLQTSTSLLHRQNRLSALILG